MEFPQRILDGINHGQIIGLPVFSLAPAKLMEEMVDQTIKVIPVIQIMVMEVRGRRWMWKMDSLVIIMATEEMAVLQ